MSKVVGVAVQPLGVVDAGVVVFWVLGRFWW